MGADTDIALIGFGEAGQAFGPAWKAVPRVHDIKSLAPATRAAMLADFARWGVTGVDSLAAALDGAALIVSLVTADQSLAVAQAAAATMARGTFYFDFNSVSPSTKCTAARLIVAAGGSYVDVAIMSPVHPAKLASPLLLSGPRGAEAADRLTLLGFTNIRVVGVSVGQASGIKMIRSVMVKGIEALTAECLLAADRAGVTDEVIASLDESWPGIDWAAKSDHHLERMMRHGLRRAAEMDQVVETLETLETGAAMTRATATRQRAIGELGIAAPPEGLEAKIVAILAGRAKAA